MGRPAARGAVGDAEHRYRGEDVRSKQCRVGGDRRPPVVADDDRLRVPPGQRLYHAQVVADVLEHPVGLDLQGRGGSPVPPDVDRHGPEPGRGDDRQLVPPRVPRLGESVDEQDQRTGPFLHTVDPGPASIDDLVPHGPEAM